MPDDERRPVSPCHVNAVLRGDRRRIDLWYPRKALQLIMRPARLRVEDRQNASIALEDIQEAIVQER